MIYDTFKDCLINMWPLITIIVVSLACCRIAYLRNHRDSFHFHDEFWKLIAVLYFLLLYQLVTQVEGTTTSGLNLIPFNEIRRYEIGSSLFIYNVLGNIALFIPFGFIVAAYAKPKKCWSNIIIAAIVSCTIEFVQLQIGRSFDIDDIILNVLGGLIGYLLYVGINAIRNHVRLFKTDWFNNLICIIITICIVLYMLNFWGIDIGL